jgi:hypothetical protein
LVKYASYLSAEGCHVETAFAPPALFAGSYDLIAFAAIFTWDLPKLVDWVRLLRAAGYAGAIEIGGPAVSGSRQLAAWVERETGVAPHRGVDERFEHQPGDYRMTFTSRGCPGKGQAGPCSFCIVPWLEGIRVVEHKDFSPAPIILDNNLLATSRAHQERVVERLLSAGIRHVDIQSGFDAARFDQAAFDLWKCVIGKRLWRLAYDFQHETGDVERMIRLLRENGVASKDGIAVYVLTGNEPFEACYDRAQRVAGWGALPKVQPLIPLQSLVKQPEVKFDWTRKMLLGFCRYWQRPALWRSFPIWEFRPRKRQTAPFAFMTHSQKILESGAMWYNTS